MADCTKTTHGGTPSTYERSGAWETTGVAAAANIVEISGKVGAFCIGMSSLNTIAASLVTQFHADPDRHSSVTLVNGGISGKVADNWSNPDDDCWTTLTTRITNAGLTAAQCQIVWVMMAQSFPATDGEMTEAQLLAIWSNLKTKYPNLQIGFVSSHPYTGYSDDVNISELARTRLPEPHPYNGSLLMASMVGHGSIPFWVDFYDVWAQGPTVNPRTAKVGTLTAANDAFGWDCADANSDGVHPSVPVGRNKVRDSILERWRVDPVAAPLWLGGGDPPNPPVIARRGIVVAAGGM